MKNVLYLHGAGGSAQEAEHYRLLFPGDNVIGIEYLAQTPWEAQSELREAFDQLSAGRETILIANSIGAYFSLHVLADRPIARAYFISPVVTMEELIRTMMGQAGVTEEELRQRKTIPTASGPTLSWDYLCFAREHSIVWPIPTHVLYGEKDALTSLDAIRHFCGKTGATLEVMKNGEHWFHTKEEMAYLDRWITTREKAVCAQKEEK